MQVAADVQDYPSSSPPPMTTPPPRPSYVRCLDSGGPLEFSCMEHEYLDFFAGMNIWINHTTNAKKQIWLTGMNR